MKLCLGAAIFFAAQFASAQEGWHALFDGSSSKGWVEVTGKPFPTLSWAVEDGCLKSLMRSDGPEDIRTVKTFQSFELQFEWKLQKLGDSGVKYLIQRDDDWTNTAGRQAPARGLGYQLADLESPGASDPTRITGALYSILAPANANSRLGVFNESRIIVRGDHVEHWLNGVKELSFQISNPAVQKALNTLPLVRESAISLENHGSEAWFKNIKIRPLP